MIAGEKFISFIRRSLWFKYVFKAREMKKLFNFLHMALTHSYYTILIFFYQIVLIPCDFLTLNLREVWIKNYLDFLEIDRFYADDGDDIVLIYSKKKDQFFALGAVCSHEGSSFINPRLLWLVPPFLRFNVGPRGESRRNLG